MAPPRCSDNRDRPAALTYGEMLRDAAARAPDAEALVFPGARLTYRELLERATWRARELQALGVGAGDKFGILMPNSPNIVELMFGGAMLGAVMVPINTRFRARELRHVITDAELAALITTDEFDEHVSFKELLYEALPGLADARAPIGLRVAGAPRLNAIAFVTDSAADGIVDAATVRRLAAGCAAPGPADGPAPDATAIIMYTSGTTANPKGCVLSHRAIQLDAAGVAERFALTPADRMWNPLPLFHSGGIMLSTAIYIAGATFISQARFDVDEAFSLLRREHVTIHYPLFPTITLTLMHDSRFAALDLSRARIVCSVAPPDVQRQIQDAYRPAVLVNAYGITELCGTVVFSELDDGLDTRIATCGRPLPGFEVRIVDPETNVPLAPNERGELVGRGPSRFDGYYRDPEQTARAIDADGFFHTGDLASVDDAGRICYHGRLKDMLKVGGENVAAIEVESFLATHPAVKLAQVVGVPDDRLQEIPAAFVELVPGARATEAEIIEFCAGAIASFKVPRHVQFVTEWPMSATKVQKFRLRDRLIAERSAAEAAPRMPTGAR
jgi:acyl-CoA synthetase (AMP-forming)/AMP-acid ligase II